MNIYSIPTLIGSALVLGIGLLVWLKNKKSEINIVFGLYNFSIFFWLISYTIAYSVKSPQIANFWCRVACISTTFIAPTFYHFALSYLKIKKERKLVFLSYLLMCFFALLFRTEYFLKNTPYKYFWGYYSKAGILHPVYLLFFFLIITRGFFLIWKAHKKIVNISPLENLRLKYIFFAYLIHSGAAIDYLPKYGFEIYPFGWLFAISYSLILSYTILKHRLMDIRIFLTRATIFIFIYSLVFAIPIILGITTKLWIISILLMGILSPIGMFVYGYLREQLEDVLFKQQELYQEKIKELAHNMIQITSIDRLFNEIVPEIYKLVNPEFIGFYQLLPDDNYTLNKDLSKNYNFNINFPKTHTLIEALNTKKQPILIETVFLSNFPFETIAIPFFTKDKLFAFIILGPKPKRALYTKADFTAFEILSFQVSLALQNAYHLEELRNTQLQLLRQENLKFVSVLVKGLAHEILNPLTPLMHRIDDLETEGLLKIYELYEQNINNLKEEDKIKFKNTILELKETTKSLKENANHIHLIIKTLNDMQKGDSQTMSLIDIKSFFKDVIPLLSIEVDPKIQENVSINQDIEKNLPPIKGNAILLKQVFINLYKNACEAMLNTKNKLIEIIARLDDIDKKNIIIEFKDTGPGMSGEVLSKLFTMGFSTKGKLGSGIGLNQAKAIIEKFGGSISVESKLNEGTKFIIKLPVYQS